MIIQYNTKDEYVIKHVKEIRLIKSDRMLIVDGLGLKLDDIRNIKIENTGWTETLDRLCYEKRFYYEALYNNDTGEFIANNGFNSYATKNINEPGVVKESGTLTNHLKDFEIVKVEKFVNYKLYNDVMADKINEFFENNPEKSREPMF